MLWPGGHSPDAKLGTQPYNGHGNPDLLEIHEGGAIVSNNARPRLAHSVAETTLGTP
jgi:hypothetical protein